MRRVAAVVEDHVRSTAVGQAQRLLGAPPVLLERLALPGEDRARRRARSRRAAWSCVEKMLQEHQRTSAPSATSVSISTAVWIVMCSEPVMRAPLSGCASWNSRRIDIRPGISCSASSISLRPKSASERSATLKSSAVIVCHAISSWSVGVGGGGKQRLVLLLLPAQPIVRGDELRPRGLGLEPLVDGAVAAPARSAGAGRSRARRARSRSGRAAPAASAGAAAARARTAGSRRASVAARAARHVRCSAASAATSPSSARPR